MKPRFVLDRTHLLIGWRKDGWKGPHLQWEFGAYVNLDLALSNRHDYRLTYNTKRWRTTPYLYRREPLRRFEFSR